MLDAFPIYHWFHNGNPYSGAEGGMRYVITPIKVPDPSDESGKKKREALCAEVWPGPWSIEHTAEEKIETQLFDGDQAGLDKAVAWLHERYTAETDRWADIPSILVETGFISNNGEERLLGSDDYQEQIAEAIYNGLRNYFMQHPLQSAPRGEAAQTASAAAPGGMLIN